MEPTHLVPRILPWALVVLSAIYDPLVHCSNGRSIFQLERLAFKLEGSLF
jgi:hypothetical protein